MTLKVAQSLSLQQADYFGGVKQYAAKWLSPRHHYYAWVVSAMLAKAAYGNVHLIADGPAKEVLVDVIGIPYDTVSVSLGTTPVPPRVWCVSKLEAFRSLVDDGQPFIHIDGDVFLFGRLPKHVEEAGVIAQNREDDTCHPVRTVYTVPKRNLMARLPHLPEAWPAATQDYAYNTGLFGGSDTTALRQYVDATDDLVRSPANRAAWQHIGTLQAFEQWSFNCVIEQHTLFAVAQQNGTHVRTLFGPSDICSGRHQEEKAFYHALGEKNVASVPGSLTYRLAARVEKNWPAMKRRIDDWLADA